MCNLYTVRKSVDEVARHFGVKVPDGIPNTPERLHKGSPGLVVVERDGERALESMTWGHPSRPSKMKAESKSLYVNNIADFGGWMWRKLAEKPKYRCLIPFDAFAEAEGPDGAKTITWMTVDDEPAWLGLWNEGTEFGNVYAGAMTDANKDMSAVHTRMPIFAFRDEWDRFMHGSFEDLMYFQKRVFPEGLIKFNRTPELWFKGKRKDPAAKPAPKKPRAKKAEPSLI